jgi:uridine phosphorylase
LELFTKFKDILPMPEKSPPFILLNKNYQEPSIFLPENLLREARRQKNISECNVPEICVLDPDGDLADYLLKKDKARKNNCWACYHSTLYTFQIDNIDIGIIPAIVGASYAVLVAEQLFVSGCQYLISVTSAGIIKQSSTDKRFALIKEAVRDEGTSYHYMPKDVPSTIPELPYQKLSDPVHGTCPWFDAKSWTTDAPYRETATAISTMEAENVACVEMEAAALYSFALAKNKNVICFAHLTNTMAQQAGDFEKGEHFGSIETLNLLKEVIKRLGKSS